MAEINELLQLVGIQDARRRESLKRMRDRFGEICSLGAPACPVFTLHNVTHSDNLIHLLSILKTELKFQLNEYEAYLLIASAYLHDIGMFVDPDRIESLAAHELRTALEGFLCPNGKCDSMDRYELVGKPTSDVIRRTHNILSAEKIQKDFVDLGLNEEDVPYLMLICRGHRRANLQIAENGCNCYRLQKRNRRRIRLSLLTMLLRIIDEFDFYDNRAPRQIFKERQAYFLKNRKDLEHWMRHYFVADPDVCVKKDPRKERVWLECGIHIRVPRGEVNGVQWEKFIDPLFTEHIQATMDADDLDLNRLPHPYVRLLGIDEVRIRLGHTIVGGISLPIGIAKRIEQSACNSVLDFLSDIGKNLEETAVEGELEVSKLVEETVDVPTPPFLEIDIASLEFCKPIHRSDLGEPRMIELCNVGGEPWRGEVKARVPWLEVREADVLCQPGQKVVIEVHLTDQAVRLRRKEFHAQQAIVIEGEDQKLTVSADLAATQVGRHS